MTHRLGADAVGRRSGEATLIVGQGLAGTFLAEALLERGEPVEVVDDGEPDSASRVGLGLVAPLGGRRWTRAGELERLIPACRHRIGRIERRTGRVVRWSGCMFRRFSRHGDRKAATERLLQPAFRTYLGSPVGPGEADASGGIWIREAMAVAMEPLIQGYRRWLAGTGRLWNRHLDFADLRFHPSGVSWGERRYRRVVFCEGAWVRLNPWFHPWPVGGLKGELLEGEWPGLARHPVAGKLSLVPLGSGRFRFGATHDRDGSRGTATASGWRQLNAGLGEFLGVGEPPRITAHRAGLRPTSPDGLPMTGTCPTDKRLAFLNGLGGKGLLLGPYFADRLADYLLDRGEIPPEADLRRFGGGS